MKQQLRKLSSLLLALTLVCSLFSPALASYSCENCGKSLSDNRWYVSTDYPEYHYQTCASCNVKNYYEHDLDANGVCRLCSYGSYYSQRCTYCSSSLSYAAWSVYTGNTDYHYQTCRDCGRDVYGTHTNDSYGYCTICGYHSTYGESYHTYCENCHRALDSDEWEVYPRDTDYHYQTCDYCNRTHYYYHTPNNLGYCTVCGYHSTYGDDYHTYCENCHRALDSDEWEVYPRDTDYHYQTCDYCDETHYYSHIPNELGYCTVCGYHSTYGDDYTHSHTCDKVGCNRTLDSSKWLYSSQYPDYHYQSCTCGNVNYRNHVVGSNNRCVYCGIVVTSTSQGNITVTISQDVDYYYFDDDDTTSGYSVYDLIVENLPTQSTGNLNNYYVTFSGYSSTVGTISGNKTTTSSRLTDLDEIYLSIDTHGTWSARYTVTRNSSTVLSGTLYIVVEPSYESNIIYGATLGENVVLDAEDFVQFWDSYTDGRGDLSYVRIDSVKGLNGTLCYKHTSNESRHTTTIGNSFYADPAGSQKDLDALTFIPAKSGTKYTTGTVTISFTAVGSTRYSKTASAIGTLVITYTNGDVDPINYNCVAGYTILDTSDFINVYKSATNTATRIPTFTIKFLDVPTYGTLYHNYSSNIYNTSNSTELTERNISTLSFSSLSNNANSIGKVAYVPSRTADFTDTVRYAAFSGNTLLYIGTITFKSEETIITYGCTAEGVNFSTNDFFTSASSLYAHYICFGTPSSGTLYKDYANGKGTVVNAYDSFSYTEYSGVYSLNDVTYVPKAGYTGVVEIPFYGNSLAGSSIAGIVRIYVVSNGFSDVSGWSASYINRLYASGIVGGTSATTFSPKANMKYGEALKMILVAAGYPKQSETGGSHWASNYLSLAYRQGIVSSTSIDLNAEVNRNTVAELAAKALGLSSTTVVAPGIVGPNDSTNGYVIALYNAGIVGGEYSGGYNYFYGNRNITREEVAKIICNIMDYKK